MDDAHRARAYAPVALDAGADGAEQVELAAIADVLVSAEELPASVTRDMRSDEELRGAVRASPCQIPRPAFA
jgi:hypothetical protein